MESNFKIQNWQDGKRIRLSSPLTSRTRILNYFYALSFLAGVVMFCRVLPGALSKSIVGSVIALLAIVAFGIAFYRFINKATESETLFVDKERLELIVSRLFKQQKRSFLLTDISEFRFLETERYEPHPLKGESFDYLGFQTEQRVIQDLHMEGRVSFMYQGRQIRFGKDLVSWEFNELEVLLYDLTGNDFRYTDKFEKENFPRNEGA